MGVVNYQPKSKFVAGEFQSTQGYCRRIKFTDLLAVAATKLVSAHALDGTTLTTVAAQPDVARNLTIVASGSATGNVDFTGTDIRGTVITERLALNGNTPVLGTKAFASVTSIKLPTVADRTINVGIGVKIGLDRKLSEDSVLYVTCDGVYEATRPTVTVDASDISKNTFQSNTAPDDSKDFVVGFMTTELF